MTRDEIEKIVADAEIEFWPADKYKLYNAIESLIRKAEDEAIEKCAKVADMCELGNGDIAEEIAIRIRKLKMPRQTSR